MVFLDTRAKAASITQQGSEQLRSAFLERRVRQWKELRDVDHLATLAKASPFIGEGECRVEFRTLRVQSRAKEGAPEC